MLTERMILYMTEKQFMSGSELRQYLHISTRKMKYLMDNNYINRTEWHPLPMFEATPENCEAFRRWLESQWAELPEALPTQTAAELVGHSPQRIHEWIREETLTGIKLGTVQYCAKAEFIGFIASPQSLAHPRTEKYKELIREFKYIQRRERENEQRRQKRKMMKEST